MKFCKFLYYINSGIKISIYFSNDLTINERSKRKALVDELKRRKEENKEQDLVIKGGEIVKLEKPFQREAQPNSHRGWAELFK